jgi:hypothetical protein
MKEKAMSVLLNHPAPAKSKPKKQRVFGITFHIEGDDYRVAVLPVDPAIGYAAFHFRKLTGDKAEYHVHFNDYGGQCDCMGHMRHGHCKHTETIQAAAKRFNLKPPAPQQGVVFDAADCF